MSIPPGTAEQLRKRQETIHLLRILIGTGPIVFTVLLAVLSVIVVVDVAKGSVNEAALGIALVLIPIVGLSWLSRHLINVVLDNLDICLEHDPAEDSARQ